MWRRDETGRDGQRQGGAGCARAWDGTGWDRVGAGMGNDVRTVWGGAGAYRVENGCEHTERADDAAARYLVAEEDRAEGRLRGG